MKADTAVSTNWGWGGPIWRSLHEDEGSCNSLGPNMTLIFGKSHAGKSLGNYPGGYSSIPDVPEGSQDLQRALVARVSASGPQVGALGCRVQVLGLQRISCLASLM